MKLSLSLALLLQTLDVTSAFTALRHPAAAASSSRHHDVVASSFSSSHRRRPQPLQAVIYHPNWEEDETIVSSVDEDYFAKGAEHHEQLIQSILQRDPSQAALARLAAAFCPPGRQISLDRIESVNLLAADEHHINIEAVLCENDGCVSLSVPIHFPVSCGTADSLQDCVMDNLGKLHTQAATRLEQVVWEADNYEQVQAVSRERQELAADDEHDLQLPTWWVAPADAAMQEECGLLKGILNDQDFYQDIQTMAVALAVQQVKCDTINDVTAAAVVRIGPSGMLLRVSYPTTNGFGDAVSKRHLLEVRFSSTTPALTPTALREAVMATLETAPAASVQQGLNLSF